MSQERGALAKVAKSSFKIRSFNLYVSVLEPLQEGNITIRVPRSTEIFNISAAFSSSTLTGRGFDFIANRRDEWLWWSIGETEILVND